MEGHESAPRVVRFGAFLLDRRAGELRKDGLRLRLQEQPLRVLDALLAQAGEPVTREELRRRLWPDDTFVDFDNGLNRAINRLRLTLGDSAASPRFIETLERRGYRFIAPVTLEEPPAAASQGAPLPHSQEARPTLRRRTGWTGPMAGVALATLIAVGVGVASLRRAGPAGAAPIRSLAVLPLANLTGDAAYEYFSDGMTDALITDLASLPALHVISRQSVMRYKGSAKPLPEIARELGVDAVVEGSVARSRDRVRVTAQLVHAPSDRHVWARSYDRDLADVLELQSEIAAAVASQVHDRLGARAPAARHAPREVAPRAYELYLQGRFNLHQLNPASLERAVEYFEKARSVDPGFARAHAGIAAATFMQEFWGGRPRSALQESVRESLRRALELDPDLSDAQDTLGRVLLHYDYDWAGAEAAFRRAIELEPSSVAAHNGYSILLQALARYDEALAEAAKAVALDPLSPMAVTEEGRVLYRARRFAAAEERYRRALDLNPGFGSALDRLAQLYLTQGRLAEAREAVERLERLPSHRRRFLVGLRGRLEAAAGNRAAARRLLGDLPGSPEFPRATIHVALGEHDRAFAELDQAVSRKTLGPYAWGNPELDPLRADPRFARAVARMGLPADRIVALGRAADRRAGEAE
jgi:TolB-like protein/DNA-binding winged helix-turn-helix (wHTH) protein/Tfp pilus assembly protein PilF